MADEVRSEYKTLSGVEIAAMARIKKLGQNFIDAAKDFPPSREMSLAITNAEQAVMWAVKSITKG